MSLPVMKVALLNAFPNLLHSAEREFIERCLDVLRTTGHEARSVDTSDDIIAFDPDLVIVTHEFVAKVTDHFTVGLLWSPTRFYRDDEERLKSIRSWDLVVPINAATRRAARNLHFPLRHDTAVSELDFYPSAPVSDLPLPDAGALSVAYVGAHWDGQRHRPLLEELAKLTELHVYGPKGAWDFLPGNYRGVIPFDGRSLIRTLNRHGAVLALHKPEHAEEETPSMRVFEGCSARCVVITEPMQPLVELFGQSLRYVDVSLNPRRLAQEIAGIVAQYRAEPGLFEQTVQQAHDVFRARVCLERLLAALLEDAAAHKAKARAAITASPGDPEVAIIIRCGSRPLAVVERAVASLAAQSYRRIGLVFVRFAELEGFEGWLDTVRATRRFTFVQEVVAPGDGMRSASMWAGLRAVRSELFGMLDDDDEVFSDHVAQLVAVLARHADCDVAYAGAIRQEEDGAFINHHGRFHGDRQAQIPERRALKFMDDFDLDRLLRFDNFILSNAWLARSRVLSADVLDDPGLEVSEDVYFYLLLASRHRFQFSGRVSALWNWRSNGGDNSMLAVSQQRWTACARTLSRRLAQVQFPGCFPGRDVLGVGRIVVAPGAPARQPGPVAGPSPSRGAPAAAVMKRLLRAASGRRSFLTAADPIPFDSADVRFSIDFSRGTLPAFIASARGLSDFEPWGCWTDGPTLTLDFRSPLPQRFVLHLIGHASKHNHDLPIRVSVGSVEATLKMSARLRACRYTVPLLNADGARRLVFHIPNALSPASFDSRSRETRRLGIGLVRLDVIGQ
jgi:hypothetical protein